MASATSVLKTSNHASPPEWLLNQESNGGIRILQANENSIHLGMRISECLIHAEYYENAWSEESTIKYFEDMPIDDVHDFLNNSEFSIIRKILKIQLQRQQRVCCLFLLFDQRAKKVRM